MKKPDYLRRIMEINRISLSEIDSTNNYAAKLLLKGKVPHGTVISALHQKQGRGQRANTWEAEPGQNLTASWILHLNDSNFEKIVLLNKAISLAIRDSIASYLPKNSVTIKWPNDIFIEEKKISGTLIETHLHADKTATLICGIGINVFQTTFLSPNATSLLATNRELKMSVDEILEVVHRNFMRYFNRWENNEEIESEYLMHLFGINRLRHFLHQGKHISGVISGVDEWGRLQMITEQGLELFQAGDLSWQ
jgi:BirA family biotin operon repressor/biotin-[acetyl-CoA-carboxylase] ligase